MNLISIDVKIEESFRKKINHAAVKAAEEIAIRNTTLEAEKRCKVQAPGPGNQLPGTKYRASGNLRRSHSTQISKEQGLVKNTAKYAVYVVHGTSKMPARNYTQTVANELSKENFMSNNFLKELKKQGVLD